ncbi:MAG: ATP-dependent protease subunit HslV [Clostridiales bacterium]
MRIEATTIVGVQKDGKTALAGDGQVTMGESVIMKNNARKVRRLYGGKVVAGFAGAVADAFALFDKFEIKLGEYNGNLMRAAVELVKEWRTDKYMQKLEALLIVADKECMLIISGSGEIIEPDDGIVAIGSGGNYALAAGKALMAHSDLSAKDIAGEAMKIASSICVYTNDHIIIEEIED